MRAERLSLRHFLRQLGVKERIEPDVLPSVQPVIIVADRSEHVTPAHVACGWAQAYVDPATLAGPPARFAGMQVLSRAPGGVRVRVSLSQATGDASGVPGANTFPYASFAFLDADPANMTIDHAATIEQPDRTILVASVVNATRSTAGVPVQPNKNNRPLIFGGANVNQAGPPAIFYNDAHDVTWLDAWLPPGRQMYVEAYSPGVDTVFNVWLREYAAGDAELGVG